MSARPGVRPTPDTIKYQKIAGDPGKSIWVSANAGSGKTHILTERVLRLLLEGVAPENILCLTYTKAAAAEMKNRLAARLGQWTLMDDEELAEALCEVRGQEADEALRARARTLFALALETPGGLKINTIHAFCEAALHRFPLEAGVPVNFSVIEDAERESMINAARDEILAGGLKGSEESAQAVSTLFSLMSDSQILTAVREALGQGPALRALLSDIGGARAALRDLTGFNPQRSLARIEAEFASQTLLGAEDMRALFGLLDANREKSRRFVDILARMDPCEPTREGLLDAFMTGNGKPRARLLPAKTAKEHPELAALLEKEQARVVALAREEKMIQLVERSEALLDVLKLIHERYEAAKMRADRLDFDDLIIRFQRLLDGRVSSAWVRYKLDAGMTHILVDESQDTNPDQWRVIRLLVDEFYSGEGAAGRHRTLFGVGDEKQSIYGFQGAAPELFRQTGDELRIRAAQANKPWKKVPFRASFRTLPEILQAVDLVCARPDIKKALLAGTEEIKHDSVRLAAGGSVTLWPPLKAPPVPEPGDSWPLEPASVEKTPVRLNAERLVQRIGKWLEAGRPLGSRGRAVRASDILILVQKRGPFFREIIRALKLSGIPTPGADRLPVSEHIVVRDLLVLGDVLINPDDDLGLASVLRSPLFDVSLEQLEQLAAEREPDVSLWQALRQSARNLSFAARAYETLTGMRRNLDFERPYEFFSHILYSGQGLKKFHRRLGEEIDEVIGIFLDLALAHELEDQPSLQGFLAAMRARQISVKRELGGTGHGVRVMSVHGAKGLEAPIVILADATSSPSFRQKVFLQSKPVPLFVHGSREHQIPEIEEVLCQPAEQRHIEEYWRLLYVAMTRAEDELYVTGDRMPSDQSLSRTWYGAVLEALEDRIKNVPETGDEEPSLRFPDHFALPCPVETGAEEPETSPPPPELTPLPPSAPIEIVRPSLALEEAEASGPSFADGLQSAAEQVMADVGDGLATPAEMARNKGVALHSLLQHLAPLPQDRRKAAAGKALEHLLPQHPLVHGELVQKALDILSGEHSELLFGANSRAELPLFVSATRNGTPVRIIGRIDRTIIMQDEVLLVDFKSDARPPQGTEGINPRYLVQMGLYLRCGQKLFPGQRISAAIYWTASEILMKLDTRALLGATKQFNID